MKKGPRKKVSFQPQMKSNNYDMDSYHANTKTTEFHPSEISKVPHNPYQNQGRNFQNTSMSNFDHSGGRSGGRGSGLGPNGPPSFLPSSVRVRNKNLNLFIFNFYFNFFQFF